MAGISGRESVPRPARTGNAFPTAGYYETVPLNVKNTYVEQWNLTIQKQLGIQLAVEGQLSRKRYRSPVDGPGT